MLLVGLRPWRRTGMLLVGLRPWRRTGMLHVGLRPWRRTGVLLVVLLLWVEGGAMATGPETILLPDVMRDGRVSVERALAGRRSVREFAADAIPLAAVSQLLWAAQGITDPAGLRTAPSAGALHPLEVYLVAGAVSGLSGGVYHYEPRAHRLRRVSEGDARADLAAAALDQAWLAEAPAVIVLAAVYERTERRYGERAARYVHIEAGHAAQNVYLQAESLGLGTTLVGAFRDDAVARTIGLLEQAKPLGLLPVGKRR